MNQKNGNSIQESENKKKKNGKMIIEILIYGIALFLCAFVIPKYVVQRTIVEGDSMEPNYHDKENVLVEKISVHTNHIDRFDVIVFYPYGRSSSEYFVKRVIGLPGEKIQILDSDIYINDTLLDENYGKDPMDHGGIAEEPIVLGEDEYFVLGDNRLISQDSRAESVGPVKKENIGGKVIFKMWPFSEFGPAY